MSNMKIHVEFLAGTSIEEAIKEAKCKANLWDVCYVCFSFNGIKMSVRQLANVEDGVNKYREACLSTNDYNKHIIV